MKYSSYSHSKISKTQYTQLSNVCDEIIRRNLSNRAIISQDFLHIQKYSSTMSKAYSWLYKGRILSFFTYFLHIFRNVLYFIKNILNSCFQTNLNSFNHNKNIDYLFISHYTGEQEKIYIDSYFGEMIRQIDVSKLKIALVYINHTKHNPKDFPDSKRFDSFLLNDSTHFLKMVQIYKESLFSLFHFNGVSHNAISKKISTKARLGVFSPGAIKTQIIASQVKDLVAESSPKYVVTTYEGHAWERLCFSLAREANPLVKCVAYQHAPIFKYQHAIKRGIGNSYDPNVILASGVISKKQLLSYKKLNNSKVLLIGSGRFLPEFNNSKSTNNICLVAPEGTISECMMLFGFALECANKIENISFIFRFPPQIDIEILQKQSDTFKDLKKNISISNSSLENDINKSFYILYRGSSVVIHAVLSGLIPIYFAQDNELSMDPLFLYQENKRTVRSVADFNKKVSSESEVSEGMKSHCRNMYTAIDIEILKALDRCSAL